MTKRTDVPCHFKERVVRHVRAEQRVRACSLRPLSLSQLSGQTGIVCERLRESTALSIDTHHPDVALGS